MNKADEYYIRNLELILSEGCIDENPRPKYKDGTPAHSKYITQVFEEYDISKGEYPIPTIRNTAIKTGIAEVLWIYREQTSCLITAREMGITWWDDWNIGGDSIGQRYGATIGKWGLMDRVLSDLKNNPYSRRHIINMYQESDIIDTDGLYPCAYETIWSVRNVKGATYLDLTLIQRSNDYIVAGYINKIQYVALMLMVSNHCGHLPGKFCHLTQNLHIYSRHEDAAKELLSRPPLDVQPTIELPVIKGFYEYGVGDFVITDNIGKRIKSPLEIAI